jgi:hypothetical protein
MMFSGRFEAPTRGRYTSFAQICLIAHEKIQDLYQSQHNHATSVLVCSLKYFNVEDATAHYT